MDLTEAPIWMTAHIVFAALDAARPATCSPVCLDWLRRETGYDGLIASDDLAMNALSGDVRDRAAAAIAAGCDFVLYCPGDIENSRAAIAGAGPAAARLLEGWNAWTAARPTPPADDPFQLAAELWAMLDPVLESPNA